MTCQECESDLIADWSHDGHMVQFYFAHAHNIYPLPPREGKGEGELCKAFRTSRLGDIRTIQRMTVDY